MTRWLNLAMVKRLMIVVFVVVLGTLGGVIGGAWGYSHLHSDAWANAAGTEPVVKGRQRLVAADVEDEELELLIELTREGIENGHFGLQGSLVSGIRADRDFPQEFGFEEVHAWMERNVRWEVTGPGAVGGRRSGYGGESQRSGNAWTGL